MDGHERTIVFVEDDPFILTLYRTRLQSAGFGVKSAVDGLAAIEMLPQVRPDAVVLDLMLPKVHGLEVLKFIRTHDLLKATPVVVLSNVNMDGLAVKAIERGCNAGLLKTQCTPAKLIGILRDLIGKAEAPGGPPVKVDVREATAMNDSDAANEEYCRESARLELLRHAPQEIGRIRRDCLTFARGDGKESQECLDSLYRQVRFLSARAGLSGFTRITEVASALEAVLFEIVFNPSKATRSARQTAIQAVDCLAGLIKEGDLASEGAKIQRNVLAVDDDKVCNFAVVRSLKRANIDAVSVEDPKAALLMLEARPFDLVLLDVNMPALNGFQVCLALRRIPGYKRTPVIFVTSNGEFENRKRGILAGGDDPIAKPISPLELALKVTIRLLHPRVPDAPAVTRADGAQTSLSDAERAMICEETSSVDAKAGVEVPPRAAPALACSESVGVNGFHRGGSLVPVVLPNGSPLAAPLDRGSTLIVTGDDLHEKLREQQSTIGRLRQQNEDLRSAGEEHLEELGRINGRLDRAQAENESLVRQAVSFKEEHAATQAAQAAELARLRGALDQELAQRKQGEEQWQRELEEQKARLQAEQKRLSEARGELEAKTQEQDAARAALAALQDKYTVVGQQLEKATGSLSHEAERRAAAEAQAGELGGLRSALEQELTRRKQAEQQLRHKLEEQKAGLHAQALQLSEEQGKLEARTQELERFRTTVAGLQDKSVAMERQLESVRQSLAREAEGRAAAEHQVGELAGRRQSLEQELAQRKEAEEQLRHELETEKARLQGQTHQLAEEQAKLEARTRELEQARTAVTGLQGKCVTLERQLEDESQSLACEAEGRAAAERRAGELAGRRQSLEQELAQRHEAEGQLRRELDAEKARLQAQTQQLAEEQGKLETKTQELETTRTTVAALQDKYAEVRRQLESVNQSLARGTEGRTAAERAAGELAGRHQSLEQELTQGMQAREQLQHALDAEKARLQAQAHRLAEEQGKLGARTQELEQARMAVAGLADKYAALERQLESVSQSLAREAEGRAAAESEAAKLAKMRNSLEDELTQRTQIQEQLRRELEEETARLRARTQQLSEEQGKLQVRTREQEAARTTLAALQENYAEVQRRLEGASRSLAQEVERRTAAEGQAGELAVLRTALEQELAQRKEAEQQLRHDLKQQNTRLQAQARQLSEEQGRLEVQTQQQEVGRAAFAALKAKHAEVQRQLEGVGQSLAREVERRAADEDQVSELAGLRLSLELELAQRHEAEAQLRRELDREKGRLQAQTEQLAEEQGKLEAKSQELEQARTTFAALQDKYAAVERQLESVSQSLSREAEGRAAAEGQAGELAALRGSLEQELAQRAQAEGQLRQQLDAEKVRLQAQTQQLAEEHGKLETKTQELEQARTTVAGVQDKYAALQRQLEGVSQSLSREAEGRAAAEGQAGELAALRGSLEQELAQRAQAEGQLRQQLDAEKVRLQAQTRQLAEEQGKVEAKTQELEAAREELSTASNQAAQEALEKQRLAAKVLEAEHTKTELNRQLASIREREAVREKATQSLELQVHSGLVERKRLESSLQDEAAERYRLRLQSENQCARLDELSKQLNEKTAAEALWRQCESELQDRVRRLQERITDSGATIAVQEVEIRKAKEKVAELVLIQTALCANVHQLTVTESSLVQSRQALEEQLGVLQQSIQSGQNELAALRYALLDSSRVTSRVSQGHAQTIRQSAAGLAQITSALLSSPLSPAQRRMANSLQEAVERWIRDQIDNLCSIQFPVGAPVFQSCEFSLTEVTQAAFQAIQQTGAAGGIEAQTAISANVPEKVCGDPGHIGQLVTLLPESLLRFPEIRALALQVSVEPHGPRSVELKVQLVIAVKGTARELCERLNAIGTASNTLSAAPLGEAESGFAVCWQLACAMGGSVHLDTSADKDVRLQVLLPVQIPSRAGACAPAAAALAGGGESPEAER